MRARAASESQTPSEIAREPTNIVVYGQEVWSCEVIFGPARVHVCVHLQTVNACAFGLVYRASPGRVGAH